MEYPNSPPRTESSCGTLPKAPKKCKCLKPNCETCGYKIMITKAIIEHIEEEEQEEYIDMTKTGSVISSTHTVEEGYVPPINDYVECSTPFVDMAPLLDMCRPNHWDHKQRIYHFFCVGNDETKAGRLLRAMLRSISLDNQKVRISCAVHKQRIISTNMANEFWSVTVSVNNPTNGLLDVILEYLISHSYSEYSCVENKPQVYGGPAMVRAEWRLE